ncbi:hypothetical protein AQJ46_50570 [Streptomyces canus]|uniref:Uncharacterized protein n=1 Tax=Streptomyces canus TaxID=58343 RepID=A0A117QVS4_9ACTN|nr:MULTISPECIES: hypothetical protein [Streptomyces]KUN53001.1 hypothetical protein AQJ46_50570 [Streptomyces canus]MDI5907043.1 hypothetical protein [Streptomyces sp. 12257]
MLRANGRDAVEFARWLVRRAGGNFLYLARYLRALHQAIEENDTSLAARMMNADTVPHGLSGLYAFFVTTARADLERLGMLDISDPVTPTDLATPAWEGVAQPLLGVLTVAREPMTPEQLRKLAGIRVWPRAVRSVLARIRWLLTVRDGRYASYHPSVAQFLTDPQTQRDLPDQGVAEQEWHERIVSHYRAAAPSWADVDWPAVDRYGLAHLAHHLVRCRHRAAAVPDGHAEASGRRCSGGHRGGALRHARRARGHVVRRRDHRGGTGATRPACGDAAAAGTVPCHGGLVLRELFGILLVRRAGAALQLLYEQTTASWAMATALLENAVGPLLDALGTDGAILLHRAVRRALACTSTRDTGDSIDGVRTTLGD